MLRATVEVRRRRVSGSDQADASRGERQRRGLGAKEGRDAAIGGDGERISRKGHRAGKGCVRDGVSPRRVEAWAHAGRGAETPRTELTLGAGVCGGLLPAGARAGRRRRAGVRGLAARRRRRTTSWTGLDPLEISLRDPGEISLGYFGCNLFGMS